MTVYTKRNGETTYFDDVSTETVEFLKAQAAKAVAEVDEVAIVADAAAHHCPSAYIGSDAKRAVMQCCNALMLRLTDEFESRKKGFEDELNQHTADLDAYDAMCAEYHALCAELNAIKELVKPRRVLRPVRDF